MECLPPSSLTTGPSSHPKSPKILHQHFKFLGGFTFLIISSLLVRLREPKQTLTKLMIELNHAWTRLLPLALLKVWALPKKKTQKPLNINLFEAMYERSIVPLGLPPSQDSLKLPSHLPISLFAQIRDTLWQHVDDLLPRPHPNLPYPSLQIGDKFCMTTQFHSDLTPK